MELLLILGRPDTAVIIFDPAIVNPFRGPKGITPEPSELPSYFEPQDSIPKVSQVINEMKANPNNASDILQRRLLVGLSHSDKKGMYSAFHEYCIYYRGYTHPDTIRMAYMSVDFRGCV